MLFHLYQPVDGKSEYLLPMFFHLYQPVDGKSEYLLRIRNHN